MKYTSEKIKKLKNKLQNKFKRSAVAAATVLSTLTPAAANSVSSSPEPSDTHTEIVTSHNKIIEINNREEMQNTYGNIPLCQLYYQTDTLSNPRNSKAYYSAADNTITRNYVTDNEFFNNASNMTTTFVHEAIHKENQNTHGIKVLPQAPENGIRLAIHDEISANLGELVVLNMEYCHTKDLKVFDKLPKFDFYKKAIADGKINPLTKSPEEFEKVLRLMVNGTQDMWMKKFSENPSYTKVQKEAYKQSDIYGKYIKFHTENYNKILKNIYTICGIDFTRYMNKDVDIPQNIKVEIEKDKQQTKYDNQQLAKIYNLPAYDGKMSLAQYGEYLKHAQYVAPCEKAGNVIWENIAQNQAALDTENSPLSLKMKAQKNLNDSRTTLYLYYCQNQNTTKLNNLLDAAAYDLAKDRKPEPSLSTADFKQKIAELYTRNIPQKSLKINDATISYGGKINIQNVILPERGLPPYSYNYNIDAALQKYKYDTTPIKIHVTPAKQNKEFKVSPSKDSNFREWNNRNGHHVSKPITRWIPDLRKPLFAFRHNQAGKLVPNFQEQTLRTRSR